MSHNSETVRGTGSFRVCDGRILLFRLGPANAGRQRHNRGAINIITGQRKDWDPERGDYADYRGRTPEGRGFWAFPYPFQDVFLYSHVWQRHLPKPFRDGAFDWDAATDEEKEARYAAEDLVMRDVRSTFRPKLIWHGGPFYGRVRPIGMVGDQPWWRYERPRDFIEAARRELWCWNRHGDRLWRCKFSADHLEIFVPR